MIDTSYNVRTDVRPGAGREKYSKTIGRFQTGRLFIAKPAKQHKVNWCKTYDGRLLSKNIGSDHTNLYDMKADILKEWKDPHSGRNITWGEVGCALSHYEIYDYYIDRLGWLRLK